MLVIGYSLYLYTFPPFPLLCPRRLSLLRPLYFLLVEFSQLEAQRKDGREKGDGGWCIGFSHSFPDSRCFWQCQTTPFSGLWSQLGLLQYHCFLSCPYGPMCGYSFLLLLVSGCFNIPFGFFSPNHISVNSLFFKVYSQIPLSMLSASCSDPGWYLSI